MYKELNFLRNHLAYLLLRQAWQSINRRIFSIVIVTIVHDLWFTLLHWFELAEKKDIFYKPGDPILHICGASPAAHAYADRIIDQHLLGWITNVESRFRTDVMSQAFAFLDVISITWGYVFGPPGPSRGMPPHPIGNQGYY